jgi:hypothetical protein
MKESIGAKIDKVSVEMVDGNVASEVTVGVKVGEPSEIDPCQGNNRGR